MGPALAQHQRPPLCEEGMMPYNPFSKPIGEPLALNDLEELIARSVSEGYFVEYKADFPANNKVGHSLASFANTYGGWYIVGVKTDENNVAIDLPGLSLLSAPDPTSKIRDIAKSHISPVPIFQIQVLTVSSERAVVIVHVPEEQDTPFVTRDGRIYRRTADSSDPVHERDRYVVDQLVEHGHARRNNLSISVKTSGRSAKLRKGRRGSVLTSGPSR
jgi:hypothetical protein